MSSRRRRPVCCTACCSWGCRAPSSTTPRRPRWTTRWRSCRWRGRLRGRARLALARPGGRPRPARRGSPATSSRASSSSPPTRPSGRRPGSTRRRTTCCTWCRKAILTTRAALAAAQGLRRRLPGGPQGGGVTGDGRRGRRRAAAALAVVFLDGSLRGPCVLPRLGGGRRHCRRGGRRRPLPAGAGDLPGRGRGRLRLARPGARRRDAWRRRASSCPSSRRKDRTDGEIAVGRGAAPRADELVLAGRARRPRPHPGPSGYPAAAGGARRRRAPGGAGAHGPHADGSRRGSPRRVARHARVGRPAGRRRRCLSRRASTTRWTTACCRATPVWGWGTRWWPPRECGARRLGGRSGRGRRGDVRRLAGLETGRAATR